MKADKSIYLLAVIGSLILVNVVVLPMLIRIDLTQGKQYTLSDATEQTLDKLSDPVTVTAYFSSDMPSQLATHARDVQDMLEEFYALGRGNFRYEFIDPTEEETEEDKAKKKDVKQDIFGRQVRERTSIETELEALGIRALDVQVRDGESVEVRRVYMSLAVKHGDATEVIPIVQDTSSLEYDITTLIKKLTRDKTPKVAIVVGDDSVDPEKEMANVHRLLEQQYEVITKDLNETPTLEDDVDAVIVLGTKVPYSPQAQAALDTFVASGRSAAFLLDAVKPDLSTLQAEEANHGLGSLMTAFGATLSEGLVLDVECATISVQRQRGFMRIAEPVQYPFMPLGTIADPDHPLTRGMSEIAFPFTSPIEINAADGGDVEIKVLAKSSENSWVVKPPYNLDPFKRWTKDDVGEQTAHNLMVTITGNVPSLSAQPEAAAVSRRVLVAGGSSFVIDQFMSAQNQALVLNLVDWLLLDEALLAMRSRSLGAKPLDEMSDGTKATVKYANIAGLPLAFVVFYMVRWRRRESRRSKVTL